MIANDISDPGTRNSDSALRPVIVLIDFIVPISIQYSVFSNTEMEYGLQISGQPEITYLTSEPSRFADPIFSNVLSTQ